jgi:hypothetical protein
MKILGMKILGKIKLVFLILLSTLTLSAVAESPIKVKLYLPENFDAHGKQIPNTKKLDEVFAYFEREAELQFEMIVLPWKRAQLEAQRGNGLLYGYSKTSERVQTYRFSKTVIALNIWGVAYGEPALKLDQMQDLKNRVVLLGWGLSHGLEFDKTRDKLFTVQESLATDRERFKRLATNPQSVILIPERLQDTRLHIETYINENLVPSFNDPTLKNYHFTVSSQSLFVDTIHFATGKGHLTTVFDRIDHAISKGSKDGSLSRLLRDYE